MLTFYLQSMQLNVGKFSTCTYKLQIVYHMIPTIVLVFTTQVTKLPPKCSHSHRKKKERKERVSATTSDCCCGPLTHGGQRRHGGMRQQHSGTCAVKWHDGTQSRNPSSSSKHAREANGAGLVARGAKRRRRSMAASPDGDKSNSDFVKVALLTTGGAALLR